MCVLITTTPQTDDETKFVEDWMDVHTILPQGSTTIHAVNDTWSPVAVGSIANQRGLGYLEETSHSVTYRISPFSFFQTNTQQLPSLVERTMDAAGITANDVVWDLYCGTGTLTFPAARRAKHVIGVELVESSIIDAKSNAELNGINNVELYARDLHQNAAIEWLRTLQKPDVVIVDPPRNGMHAMLVEHLLSVGAPRIAYVSCNPATQARDCALLAEMYDVVEVTPVDMFPQTYHIESVAVLIKKSSSNN
jgi:23S rRNA (uracil1939-C5)-methyltransferase